MSFGLPSVKVRSEPSIKTNSIEGPFGVPSPLVADVGSTRNKLAVSHPLEASEKNFRLNEEKMNMAMLRNVQGLHAPLKISMELRAASKLSILNRTSGKPVAALNGPRFTSLTDVGRLPFLSSSNMMHDILTGRHIDMDFEDVLNPVDIPEVAGQPHAVVERSLGLL